MGESELPRWSEIAVLAPADWSELVAERLGELFGGGLAFGAPSLASDPIPDGFELVRAFSAGASDPGELERSTRAALAELAAQSGSAELADLAVRARRLPPEDFATSWQKGWKPFRVGRLAIVGRRSNSPRRASDRTLVLEPGGAFGTGRHATTRASLRAIQARVRGGELVLDAGTGNGILSVAALLLGARRAVAFDLDPHAVPYADELARENQVRERCDLRIGGFEVLGPDDVEFDAVFANIYADLIQAHAAELARRLACDGWFVFSGCHRDKRAATELAIERAGLAVERRESTGRWDTYGGRRSD